MSEIAKALRIQLLNAMEGRRGFSRDGLDEETITEWNDEWDAIITAALPPAMIWTTQKPSKPGWYWWREPEHNDGTPEICHVYRSEGGELRVLWTTDCTFADLLSEYDGEWSGPIAPPLEPPQ